MLLVVMALVIIPLIVICQVIAYWRIDVVDDQMFGYFGWRIAHGATVYLDVWDNKPPAIYWINAVGMFVGGGSYAGVIAMCVLALVISHVAAFVIGCSLFHRSAAALTTILLSFFLMHGFYTGGTNRTETFLVACELSAVAFYMRGWARDRWWKWYAAGLLCGLAFLFKQVGLAAWGCMGLHTLILVCTRELRLRDGLRRGLLLLAGAATTVYAAGTYLWAQGALGEALRATFTFNAAYFSHGASRFPYNLVNWYLLQNHVRPILLAPLLMALAAGIHAFLWWLRPYYRPPEIADQLKAHAPVCPRYFLLFAMWFVVAFYGALMSPHGFRHYLVPSIPPLILLGGYLINVLLAERKLLVRVQQRAWVLVAFVVLGYFSYEALTIQFHEFSIVWVHRIDPWLSERGFFGGEAASVGAYKPAHWETVGDAVASVTEPDDRIQCFGYMPGVYLHARRINASRFTTTEKIGHVRERADWIARELEETLAKTPPPLIVMPAEDYHNLHDKTRATAWPVWTRLDTWLAENYRLIEDIPKFGTVYVFIRNDRFDPERFTDLTDRLSTSAPAQP